MVVINTCFELFVHCICCGCYCAHRLSMFCVYIFSVVAACPSVCGWWSLELSRHFESSVTTTTPAASNSNSNHTTTNHNNNNNNNSDNQVAVASLSRHACVAWYTVACAALVAFLFAGSYLLVVFRSTNQSSNAQTGIVRLGPQGVDDGGGGVI